MNKRVARWNTIPNNLKAVSVFALLYPILTLLVWIINLVSVSISQPDFISLVFSQMNFYLISSIILNILILLVIPFLICLYIAKAIKSQKDWARMILIMLASIVFFKEVPLLVQSLIIPLSFDTQTLMIIIPSLLKLAGSAGIVIYLSRNKVKKVFK